LKDKLEFIGKVYPFAKALSDKTGLPLPFILGHTAHEVDWGKKVEGNNLFNLKADENWQGPTYTRNDTRYRAYPTYAESMKDYQTFLENNPLYGKMFEPVTRASTDKLADAVRYAGYSDDPFYGMRITTAAKSPLMKRALWQYDKWPPDASQEG
jgi:flagellar protein FlgJ